MNNKKLISCMLTAATLFSLSGNAVRADSDNLSVESYSVLNKYDLLLNMNKAVSAEEIKASLIVKDRNGKQVSKERINAENHDSKSVAISIDDIYRSFEYNISFDADNLPIAEDGSKMEEEYEYRLSTDGIESSDYESDFTGETDEWTCYTTNATSSGYKGYALGGWFFFGNKKHEYEETEDGQIRSSGSANAHCKDYESAMNFEDFTLEFDYKNMSEAGVYKDYAPFRVFFRTDEYTPSKPEGYGYYPNVKSDRGGYILELFNCAQNVNLLKWDGTPCQNTDMSSGANAKSGITAIYPKQTVQNSIGTESRYKLIVKNTEEAFVHITVMRAVYTDGVLGDYDTIIDYTDTDKPITDGTFWFSQRGTGGGTNWGGYWYGSSFIRNLKCYQNADWNVERKEIPRLSLNSAKMIGNGFVLAFSHDMSKDEILNNVYVYKQSCEKGKEIPYEVSIDGNVTELSISGVELGKKYYLYVDRSIKSKLGYSVERNSQGYVYTAAAEGMPEADFSKESEKENWISKGSTTENVAFVYNNMLFMSSEDAKSFVSNVPKASACFVYNKKYTDFMYENSTLEFDYRNNNNTAAVTNGQWAGMHVIFRTDELKHNLNQWNQFAEIESKGGGYWLELFNYGKTVALRKWNGGSRAFAPVATLNKKDADVLFYNDVSADVDCDKYRYRIITVNLENGVRISVFRAKYDSFGELGDYTLVGEAEDLRAEAPRKGSFAFSAEGSTVDDNGKGWLSSHSVNNITYFTPVALIEMTDIKDLKEIAESIQYLGGFNGRTTVTAEEYDNLEYSINLGIILERAGYSENEILGYTDALSLQTKIPKVTSVKSTDLSTEYKVDFETSVGVASEYINKDNITVLKNGEKFDDYTIENVSSSKFTVAVYNDKKYDSRYTIILSKNIASEDGMIFSDDYTYTLDSRARVSLSDIVLTDKSEEIGTATVSVNGDNTAEYTVMLCVYEVCEINGKDCDKLISINVGKGSSITTEFTKPQRYYAQATVYSDTADMVQLFKTITSEEVIK